ncbi:hypothetical protein J2J97_32045 (plasmid) [Rhizobium bangladeshense]|uniref:ParB N-terminal domain-containing protein n=1 Tax=Rhizobium bangladeshense TaxID=1138189 RepID=UPI001A983EFD|nr:ParB N-terminal domain-containing protein [Rhizobium bangladeshense]QSY98539.1 hypothetical protein J2J97_32045 [Rhizobium bangladeshense]
MNKIDLVALSQLEPAVYNPRETDPFRLRLLQLSLSKLGFILPLYATPNGHLLSGHQRLLCAELLQSTHAPLVYVDTEIEASRNINLVFNRATNDMKTNDTSDKLLSSMNLDKVTELAASISDKKVNTPEFYRCMTAELQPIEDLLKMEKAEYELPAVTMAAKLFRWRLFMPIVVTDSGRIINGSFRLYAAADRQSRWEFDKHVPRGQFPVVTIPDAEGDLAVTLLNMISMRFTLERQYADQLRFGAFRRPTNIVKDILPSLRVWVDGRPKTARDSLKDPTKFWHGFRKEHGESLLDFGAGQRRQEDILRQKGVECLSWEPYPCPQEKDEERLDENANKGEPNLALVRRLTDHFLAEIAAGRSFSTITLAAVLNSVPFEIDRRYVLLIVSALCSYGTRLVGSVRHVRSQDKAHEIKTRLSGDGKTRTALSMFPLDYEPNLTLGDISVMPKVQRFHEPEEIDALLKLFFMKTEVMDGGQYIFFRCTAPRRPKPELLKKALLHEFNLPYRDGETIDRGKQALAAFGQRLKINFDEVPDV